MIRMFVIAPPGKSMIRGLLRNEAPGCTKVNDGNDGYPFQKRFHFQESQENNIKNGSWKQNAGNGNLSTVEASKYSFQMPSPHGARQDENRKKEILRDSASAVSGNRTTAGEPYIARWKSPTCTAISANRSGCSTASQADPWPQRSTLEVPGRSGQMDSAEARHVGKSWR